MANEKTISVSFRVASGGSTVQVAFTKSADLAGIPGAARQSIATGSWQALNLPTLSSIQRIAIKNEDATNYVEIAFDNAGSSKLAKLVAGDGLYVPLPASITALYAQANTAACILSFTACEP